MSRQVEELHNVEDASSLMDSLLLFAAIAAGLFVLGFVFWSAF